MERELPPVFKVLPQETQALIHEALRLGMSQQSYQGAEAAAACDKALESARMVAPSSPELTRAIAGLLLLKSQILEREGQNPRLQDALTGYEKAIEELGRLEASEAVTREIAVAWMNRGNVLQRMGEPNALQEALKSYDTTIEKLQSQIESDVMARNTVGAALLNRGTALQRLNTQEGHALAVRAYEQAIEVFRIRPEGYEEHFGRLSAGALLNRGGALLAAFGASRAPEALLGCNEVLKALKEGEERDLAAADLSMRARRLACEGLGVLLQATAQLATPERPGWISEATDHAEHALQLAQTWEHKGVLGFRPVVPWFLHYGAAVYSHHQPQFLSEFLVDTLDGASTPAPWKSAPQLKQIALQSIQRVRQHLGSELFRDLKGPDAEKLNEVINDLQQAEARLNATPPPAAPPTTQATTA